MDDAADTAHVIIRPPLAWGLAVIAGLALDWLVPLPFLPAGLAAGWLGAMVFVLTLALLAWAIVTITRGGSQPADHRHRRERTAPLHAQPHLPRPVPGSDRLGHCVRQSLAADHAGALRPRHLLRRSGPRGSLSRAQVRRCSTVATARVYGAGCSARRSRADRRAEARHTASQPSMTASPAWAPSASDSRRVTCRMRSGVFRSKP